MMKKITYIMVGFILLNLSVSGQDSTKTNKSLEENKFKHGHHFVDEDGDGYNDNAPDHDGDGIPNGLDPDYQKMKRMGNKDLPYVDANGDGINDNIQKGKKHGRKNKLDSSGVKPQSTTEQGEQTQQGNQQQNRRGRKNG